MSQFDLEKFLQNYKPKTIDFSPYLSLNKLYGYKRVTKKNIDNLELYKTYIKYIHVNDIESDKNYRKHIHCGGILMKGGFFTLNKFYESDNKNNWTHLMLKFIPFKTLKKTKNGVKFVEEYESHSFFIKISNYHIFYKQFRQ
ncbi:hypothetical protein QJ854_gp182 [Moumouvirus goulette]|uniref:Uncharacterized protein n=1 Tax=Moumouvirus goulette TaxID=1247379 RepID=M1NNG3_9VIRU|nr:hypothetical protein QJ854_gp182 [Moumouvirus goulette]AGF85600.1 hypothetical protein glt_00795 [Moumouvirus goulette]